MNVVISEKARIAFERMDRGEQRKARTAIEYLRMSNLDGLHVQRLSKPQGLFIGRVDKKNRIIFRKKSEHEIVVVDFVQPDEIKKFLGEG
ncbi:hypothetical protein [Photobacterium atrarenae]|uniref:Uncharacterized protein n=1 Tax=Photobacterium atrarenae TaxID=865757 RepID=A0ABY5GB60_9GAMM|nr:hypothetical protein [Photobacterium atrarenae]UTV26407.1 hypothetical protein NNL38_08430 [Photobacterium atrarenae]